MLTSLRTGQALITEMMSLAPPAFGVTPKDFLPFGAGCGFSAGMASNRPWRLSLASHVGQLARGA